MGAFEPMKAVYKDGFIFTTCIKDKLNSFGDKFGKHKADYTMGKVSNVSIVRYQDYVAPEDKRLMSPKVCFEFCRTIPDMLVFGIVNGGECYCAPYFQAMPSDHSKCDVACPGKPSMFCGGETKSSIFTMHFCDTTQSDLYDAGDAAYLAYDPLSKMIELAEYVSNLMLYNADNGIRRFGNAGDPKAAAVMKEAKDYSTELSHASDDAAKVVKIGEKTIDDSYSIISQGAKVKWQDTTLVSKAHALRDELKDIAVNAKASADSLGKFILKVFPGLEGHLDETKPVLKPTHVGRAKQYDSIMTFVDKRYQYTPQTCSGNLAQKPILTLSKDECAGHCDDMPGHCVGFAFFSGKVENKQEERLCVLYSSFDSVVYYTGCKKEGEHKDEHEKVTCMAKFMDFQGLNIKPKEDGSCKTCLKELTEAKRCFGVVKKGDKPEKPGMGDYDYDYY
eukprot:gnl/TRDRNA2_/TRDRNA2_156179_c0_seq2.p1 gnl/TRDRNA2_/TRDRNA2_156179_c0~~gnl/TRDRNA2_/TRDRNA2_156179_c0_seq2.p1  ORF type:complete len:448 (+),score=88.92 gnl/TRDRNA2_/TRDRNA2_156179_c0_seq2:228-1571(+)